MMLNDGKFLELATESADFRACGESTSQAYALLSKTCVALHERFEEEERRSRRRVASYDRLEDLVEEVLRAGEGEVVPVAEELRNVLGNLKRAEEEG